MTWKQRHALRRFVRSSLWPIPLACMVAAPAVAHSTLWIDQRTGWTLDISVDAARTVINMLEGSLLAFIVFIFSFLPVAVQLASAQFSQRVNGDSQGVGGWHGNNRITNPSKETP